MTTTPTLPLTPAELRADRAAVAADVAALAGSRALVACAGFGLVSLALREAGYSVTGIELDDAIAAVNRANVGNCITADFTAVDPRQFGGIELFQISPPCVSFSQAKTRGKETETETDIALARQTCRYIRTLKPRFFLLENVWLYRKSQSWKMILHCLKQTGYKVGFWRLCAADYGSPQTRHRMIVVARRDGIRPHKPFPTHARIPDMFCQRWRGWLDAISDLVPFLPDAEFAAWHKARMPAELLESIMAPTNGENADYFEADTPAPTICASHVASKVRAFILSPENGSHTADGGRLVGLTQADEPAFTVKANAAKGGMVRGFIADQLNGSRPPTIRLADEPAPTLVNYTVKHPGPRANIEGRTVSMIPRCYGRWQDLPDDFGLPATKAYRQRTGRFLVAFADEFTPGNVDNELACRGIGNGVPLNLARAVMRTLADEARGKGAGL